MAGAFKKSDIEILVATMHRTSLDFLGPMFPSGQFSGYNILVINQTAADKILTSPFSNVRVINAFEKGLSKSRNLALKNATGALCIITDDDVVFTTGFEEGVVKAYNENPDAALIAFRAQNGDGRPYRKYKQGRKTGTTIIDRLLILSIEIVINRRLVEQKGIQFDEQFGLGASFAMGEEAIFVHDLYNAGGKVVLEPCTIVGHAAQDTHARATTAEKYYVQGPFFSRLFGKVWLFWLFTKLASELKNKKLRFTDLAIALKAAYSGRKAFIKK